MEYVKALHDDMQPVNAGRAAGRTAAEEVGARGRRLRTAVSVLLAVCLCMAAALVGSVTDVRPAHADGLSDSASTASVQADSSDSPGPSDSSDSSDSSASSSPSSVSSASLPDSSSLPAPSIVPFYEHGCGYPPVARGVALSSDGSRIAEADASQICVLDTASFALQVSVPLLASDDVPRRGNPVFSADGRYLYVPVSSGVQQVNLDNGHSRLLANSGAFALTAHDGMVTSLDPVGKSTNDAAADSMPSASSAQDCGWQVTVTSTSDGSVASQTAVTLPTSYCQARSLAISPDEKTWFVAMRDAAGAQTSADNSQAWHLIAIDIASGDASETATPELSGMSSRGCGGAADDAADRHLGGFDDGENDDALALQHIVAAQSCPGFAVASPVNNSGVPHMPRLAFADVSGKAWTVDATTRVATALDAQLSMPSAQTVQSVQSAASVAGADSYDFLDGLTDQLQVPALTLSADGSTLAVMGPAGWSVWNAETGRCLSELSIENRDASWVMSDDGRLVYFAPQPGNSKNSASMATSGSASQWGSTWTAVGGVEIFDAMTGRYSTHDYDATDVFSYVRDYDGSCLGARPVQMLLGPNGFVFKVTEIATSLSLSRNVMVIPAPAPQTVEIQLRNDAAARGSSPAMWRRVAFSSGCAAAIVVLLIALPALVVRGGSRHRVESGKKGLH